jgi:hypothetical protein
MSPQIRAEIPFCPFSIALRHRIRFAGHARCCKLATQYEGGIPMASLSKPLKVLVVCAAFAFIGAILLGAL